MAAAYLAGLRGALLALQPARGAERKAKAKVCRREQQRGAEGGGELCGGRSHGGRTPQVGAEPPPRDEGKSRDKHPDPGPGGVGGAEGGRC